jgi:hypothetical protein
VPLPQSALVLQLPAAQVPFVTPPQVALLMPAQSDAVQQLFAVKLQLPDTGAGLVHVLPVPQSAFALHVRAVHAPALAPPQVAPLMPVQSEAAKQLVGENLQVPLTGAGLEQVLPAPQSVAVLQLVAAQVPDLTPPQVALALMPVQSELPQQLVAGNTQLPVLEAGLLQVLPVPQSAVTLQEAAEQAPFTSPVQANCEFTLVQSVFDQQLNGLTAQLPAVWPLHVPTPQSALALHVKAEQVPLVTPEHADPEMLEQSAVVKQDSLQVPCFPPVHVRPVPHSLLA